MMRALVATCLRLRFLVVAIGAAILVVGVARLQDVSLDVFPEFAPPLVEVHERTQRLLRGKIDVHFQDTRLLGLGQPLSHLAEQAQHVLRRQRTQEI